ncbi:MAG: DUF11 domain-containing protein [Methylotenera sp.]|nr:DUF11 domain-containing protein [Methylotenera sp.]
MITPYNLIDSCAMIKTQILKRLIKWVGLAMILTPLSAYAVVDLIVNSVDSPDPAVAGGVITYSLTVQNNSVEATETATGVTVTHSVSGGATYQGVTGAGVSCIGMAIGTSGPGTVTCTLPNLAQNDGLTSYTIQLKSETQGGITLGASATSGQTEFDVLNNVDNESTTVNKGANIALTKAASPAGAQPSGSTLSYTLTLNNAGPDTATYLRVSDPIPTGFSLTSLPSECSNNVGTIICDVAGSIASGGSVNIGPITGVIVAAGGSNIANVASVTLQPSAPFGTPQDPDTADNTATVNTNTTAGSDVAISKTRSVGGNLLVGSSFNFILNPSYTGGSPSSLVVNDIIPNNYTIDPGFLTSQNGWTCTRTLQTINCTKPSGGVAGLNQPLGNIVIPVTVATAGAVTNTATISSITPDPNSANNTATDGGVSLIDPTVDLGVGKNGPTPPLVVAGVPFTFNVNVNNTGTTGYFGDIEVVDNLPAGLTVTAYALNGWACANPLPVVGPASISCTRTFTAGSPLAAGATSPSVVMTTVAAGSGTFANGATVNALSCNLATCNAGDSTTYTVTSGTTVDSADIRVLKTVSPATVVAGEVLTYTLEVVNDNPSYLNTSSNVLLTDVLDTLITTNVGPTGEGYIEQVISNGVVGSACNTSPSGRGRQLTCNFPTVPVCTQGVNCPKVTIQVRPGGDGGPRTNTANVISLGTPDPDHSNETATVNNTVDPRADIFTTKVASPVSVAAGQNLTYVVTVGNHGPSGADAVSVTDTLPLDVTFVSATPSTGACATTPGVNVTTTAGNRSIVCSLGSIDNTGQQTVIVVVRPNNATRGTSITNSATASTSTTEVGTAHPANNTATAPTSILVPSLDLTLNKTESVDPVAVGDDTVYTITVTNVGPSAAENVQITDTLPGAGLSFQSVTNTFGTCPTTPAVNAVGGTLLCNLGYIPNNTARSITVTMRGVTKGVYTNNASVSSDETPLGYEPSGNNAVAEGTTVRTKVDLEVTSKVATPATVNLRDNFSYTIRVTNKFGLGLAEAASTVVSDTLPAGMELTGTPSITIPGGSPAVITSSTCTGTAGSTSFTCNLGQFSGNLAADAFVDITVPVQVVAVTSNPQTLTNTASIATSSKDVDLLNNTNSGNVVVGSSSIAGRVFRDFNNDGLFTAGDTGIANIANLIRVQGISHDGATIDRYVSTDASGNYVFTGLPESDASGYTITESTITEAYLNDGKDTAGLLGGDATTTNDQVTGIILPFNHSTTGYNFAEVPLARIGIAKRVTAGPTTNADGTFNTTFQLVVENFSLEALNSVEVTDVLKDGAPKFGTFVSGGAAATLTNGDYTIQTAPSGTCGGLNAGFTGSADTTIATIPSLASAATCNINFTVRMRPTAPLPVVDSCGGRYCNQAAVNGGTGALSGQTSATNPQLLDTSDNGSNPDPDNDNQANEVGENDPTPVSPTYASGLGIAKQLTSLAIASLLVDVDNSILVPVRLVVKNVGNEPLHDVVVTDVLAGASPAFGTNVAGPVLTAGQYVIHLAPTFSGGCSSGLITAGYTGAGGNTQLATIANMATGASCIIEFAYRFMPTTVTTYTNQAATSGVSDFTETNVTDTSDNGGNPDSDGDGNANEVGENDPTPVPYPRLALAKRVNTASTTNADGTVTVPFQLLVKNTGGEALNSVSVTDDVSGASPQFGSYIAGGAGATLTAGQYTVQSAPAFSGACTNGSVNAAYTGDASPTVASITSMAIGASCTVNFSLRFRPAHPVPGGGYINQADATGTGAQTTIVTSDLSDDGVNPDTNNNGIGNETGENDPTVVNVSFTPRIGLAKTKPVAETINANGTVTAAFRIKVQNYGTEPLINLTVSDLMSGFAPAFGTYKAGGAAASLANDEYTIQTAPSIQGACTTATLTGGYTGAAGNSQIATLTRLEVGASCEFNVTMRFKPSAPAPIGGYSNVATGTGTGEFSSNNVNDTSNNGANPDSDSDGDPSNNNIPTPVAYTFTPAIGIAKTLQSGLLVNSNGSYTGTFRLVVENLGNEELDSVTVSDVMAGGSPHFGTFVSGGTAAGLSAGQYTIQSIPTFVGACATGSITGAFDGSGNTQVASITQLAIGGTCTLDIVYRFVPIAGQTYTNQATTAGTGALSSTSVNDSSDNGTDPDPDGDGNANEGGENDPTPVPIPRIGVAKQAAPVVNNGDGTYNVPFTIIVRNAGETALSNVQVADDLTGTNVSGKFGTYTASAVPTAGQYTIAVAPAITGALNGAVLTSSGAFTGSGAGLGLLVPAASSLPNIGAGTASSAQITFTVRFFPVTQGPFNNSAVATGTSPVGGNVTDNSVDDANPDANGNGDPSDDTSPTSVSLSAQAIGVAKSVSGIVQIGVKKYRIPYTLIVANPAPFVTATNVQVTDNLNVTFPTAKSITISTPVAVSACTGTVLNISAVPFTGIGQNNLLVGNQNLLAGERCTITFTTEVDFGTHALPTVVQNNQATATTAQTSGGTVIATDLSDNGNAPDADADGNANEAGENDPTPVSFDSVNLASVTGKVYLDVNHDRIDNDGSPATAQVKGFIVEVLNGLGQMVGKSTTDANGNYTVAGLFPSTTGDPNTYYTVRFRDPINHAIYGAAQSVDDNAARNGQVVDGVITQLQLVAGVTTIKQNLPLDPSGVVYDAVTRLPVAGATVTLLNAGVAVPATCLIGGINTQLTGPTGMYQFLLRNPVPLGCPGDGVYTIKVVQPGGYLPPASTIIPPQAGAFTPSPAPGVDAIQAQAGPPTGVQPTTYFFSFNLDIAGGRGVVNNHIPLDPILGGAILMTKTSPLVNVSRGDLVPYTVTATNTLTANLTNIDIHDQVPPGFKYKVGTATIDGVAKEPKVNGRDLTWVNQTFAGQQKRVIRLMLVVGSGVAEGEYVNIAFATNNLANARVSNTATATVRVIPDPTFDCSDLIGKVFDDKNANGYQDEGEAGIANVRLATVNGLLVTTDDQGRFHITCAEVPNEFRGSNFVMKLDERTLPSGYRVTTENPRDVRMTRGKLNKLNFGAAIHRVFRVELSNEAFKANESMMTDSLAAAVAALPEKLRGQVSVVRLAYDASGEDEKLVRNRLKQVRTTLEKLWKKSGCCYALSFEEEIFERKANEKGGVK